MQEGQKKLVKVDGGMKSILSRRWLWIGHKPRIYNELKKDNGRKHAVGNREFRSR
jgi:hypothetical protein